MKNVRAMLILVNPEDEDDITVISHNLEDTGTYREDEINFLKNVLDKREHLKVNESSSFHPFGSCTYF